MRRFRPEDTSVLNYITRRALHSVIALVGLLMLVFFLSRLTGDPASVLLPVDATTEQRQEFAIRHGLDRPLVFQFGNYVLDVLRLDFGTSLRQQRDAMQPAIEAFPLTLQLAFVTMLIAIPLAVCVGGLAASRPGGLFDRLTTVLTLAGASAPTFWIAVIGVLFFSVNLHWLPTSGTGTAAHWVLPIGVLMLRPIGLLAQVVRTTMVGALNAPYVKTAWAKGVSKWRILFVHVLRNSLLPLVSVAGDLTVSMVNGAVVVETIFGWPGIGALMLNSIIQRDFAVVQACVLLTACAIFALNIVIDLIYALLDPRIRYS